MMRTWVWGIALSLSLAPAVARADALPPPPADCPRGSFGVSSHSGTWCGASTCETDQDCRGGSVCRSSSLCVRDEEYIVSSRVYRPDAAPNRATRHIGVAVCAGKDTACAGEAKCVTALRCVPAGSEPEPPPVDAAAPPPPPASSVTVSEVPQVDRKRSGCGCAAVDGSAAAGAGLFALACGVALFARRRR